ncbi:ATP-binding protein [Proteus sp. G2665]|uniref:ATP-binding protein n=1 Tax=Proteus sp. G2665 TaxID=2698878 RepID=UPI001377FE50|nr:ATP-binding protein [Proteus sp. G2665]NBN05582.1 AAA family ATPase [Proteus sp. G2665]
MKIIYVGKNDIKKQEMLKMYNNVILLLFDRWDDYDYKTSFPTYCQINGTIVELPSIKILFKDQMVSFAYLDKLIEGGWDGLFPVKDISYISNPEDITFYEQIDGHLDLKSAVEVAKILCDASYMVHIIEDENSLELIKTTGFKKSLQRERGLVKAFLDGWRFLSKQEISIGNLIFHYRTPTDEVQALKLNFATTSPLPHDINVLIGPNGIGKSQALIQLVEDWLNLKPDEGKISGFIEEPNINQVIVVSYSPFELFPLDLEKDDIEINRKDHGIYRYFGLRANEIRVDENGKKHKQIRLSRRWPHQNAAYSLISCLDDDRKYGEINSWSNKIKTLYQVLKIAIDFDEIAIGVANFTDKKQLVEGDELYFADSIILINEDEKEKDESLPDAYIPIRQVRIDEPNTKIIRKFLHLHSGVVFLKNNSQMKLSSGQRLFSYMVINILGAMRRNSLILIDEPELFLHPTLEITFIQMLKKILDNYNSKALLATHSLVTVRELPRDCVHVFERTEDGLFIKHPPFETFGGDIQRISSYVFGDKSISKPFEGWLKDKLKEYHSAENLIEALGENINEEMLIQIHAINERKL